jgi:hypothetical protein
MSDMATQFSEIVGNQNLLAARVMAGEWSKRFSGRILDYQVDLDGLSLYRAALTGAVCVQTTSRQLDCHRIR